MNAPTFDEAVSGLQSTGIAALKATLAESWNALTPQERDDAGHLLATFVKARLYEIAGHDVSDYLPALEAALLNWKVVGKQVVSDGIRKVAAEGFGLAGAFAGGALSTLIKGML